MGVWLPLALADVMNMLIVVSRRASGDTGQIKMLDRSEILRSWMLPAMASAVGEDEQEQAAFELLKSVQNLAKNHEQKRPSV